jgi:hypothetical protein
MEFQELNTDQRREAINTQQRYSAYREAKAQARGYLGSMIWARVKGYEYLVRSRYEKPGVRKQVSLGLRSERTEAIKREFERKRADAEHRLQEITAVIARQTAINSAVRLGRVPLIGARIIRALDDAGVLGSGIRIVGTNAMYAYESAAGIFIDPGLTTTEDIDLLLDTRRELDLIGGEEVSHPSFLRILRKADRTFERSRHAFRAVNRDGYQVDLIRPLRDPPWKTEPQAIGRDPDDLLPVEIEGLAWHESAPSFEAIAIDQKGAPLRIVTTDPRVWVAHKLWLSKRQDREAIRRRRDEAQAQACTVARLLVEHMPHLPFAPEHLRMLPRQVLENAAPLFRERSDLID